jgi:hypothetical protein
MDGTIIHAAEQRQKESDARRMASFVEPDSCHYRVSGPPAEISNTPEYQVLCGQATTLQVRLSSWKRLVSDLLNAQSNVYDAGLPCPDRAEQHRLTKGIAHGMNAGIGAARRACDWLDKELQLVKAEQKRIVDEFYRSE